MTTIVLGHLVMLASFLGASAISGIHHSWRSKHPDPLDVINSWRWDETHLIHR